MITEKPKFLCDVHNKEIVYICKNDGQPLCIECVHSHLKKMHQPVPYLPHRQNADYGNIAKCIESCKKLQPLIESSKPLPLTELAELASITCEAMWNSFTKGFSRTFASCGLVNEEEAQWLMSLFEKPILCVKLIFQAKKDGFENFHIFCDDVGPTLTICRSTGGNVFGGHSIYPWSSIMQGYVGNVGAKNFLFSVSKRSKHELFQNHGHAVNLSAGYGPVFGGGSDLCIALGQTNASYSNLGHSYMFKTPCHTEEAKCYLTGAYNFKAEDYAVFLVA